MKKNLLTLICATSCLCSGSLFAKTAGEKLDHAVDKAKDKAEDARDAVKDKYDDAKDAVKKETDKVRKDASDALEPS